MKNRIDDEVAFVVANSTDLNVLMDMLFLSGITIWIYALGALDTNIQGFKGWECNFSRYYDESALKK